MLPTDLSLDEYTMFTMEENGERIRTQDNRITAEPMFLVQELRRVYGIDTDYDPKIAWLYADESVEVDADEAARLEATFQQDGNDSPEGFQRAGYHETWEFVTCMFTEGAADLYIAQMKHRHSGPLRTFVDCAYRNHEWNAVRDFLAALPRSANAEQDDASTDAEKSANNKERGPSAE